jgi:hypothetical protein
MYVIIQQTKKNKCRKLVRSTFRLRVSVYLLQTRIHFCKANADTTVHRFINHFSCISLNFPHIETYFKYKLYVLLGTIFYTM